MAILIWINIILRGIMEFGIIAAFALWGYWIGNRTTQKILFCIFAPILVFTFWGFFDFRKIVPNPELFRLVQELFICAIAVIALNVSGHRTLSIIMIVISSIHYILVYTLGQTLIKK
ncbi:YrdB family protein [Clostridium pasteurianum]|uniref:DUF2568 domain-containing protein n=1 Tax=Clostridium pasteurianum BC1 TaxID=86416 RepID=R4K3N8_CLOPA|nr:YrdB family protein [Clostridium pasteurianum]AGK96336.1 Protein of unknown function (DUF2568) [Clostridium pasteurianum BC1]